MASVCSRWRSPSRFHFRPPPRHPISKTIARQSGTPDIPGLKMVWLSPWGDVASAHPWKNIIVHQTEGPAGSARGGAQEQHKNPTRRGVMVWVETDGTVYWAVADHLVPTHTDGADRNDNKYIDNSNTYHQVNKDTSIGVEFAGNYPDVTQGSDAGADRRVEDPREDAARALRHSARARLCAQLGRLQGRPLLRRLRARDAGAGMGGVVFVGGRFWIRGAFSAMVGR